MKTKNTDRAWLAGIIDGEGSISGTYFTKTEKSKHGTGKEWTYISFILNVGISNNDLRILEKTQDLLCTNISIGEETYEKTGNTNYRLVYQSNEDMINVLDFVYPYLVSKKEQADIMYDIIGIRKAKSYKFAKLTADDKSNMMALIDQLSALNHHK